ncbi:MAG: ZIP family metal transporter, partial [Candidatus Phytoplasma australasiaticum]|nr:ZIP family metal transporter [Candidatus Phytoplasma australasiaticum]
MFVLPIYGLTLVVAADSGFITLFIVILFHQIFEGFALGSRIAMIPSSFPRKAILAAAFAVTTPIGMAIGIGVLSS